MACWAFVLRPVEVNRRSLTRCGRFLLTSSLPMQHAMTRLPSGSADKVVDLGSRIPPTWIILNRLKTTGGAKPHPPRDTTARDASRAARFLEFFCRFYGQRFAVSSQPAARTGCGAAIAGGAGTVIRAGCGPFTAVGREDFTSPTLSFSSESRGATSLSASTSFSKRVNSISFCRNTS